MNLELPDNVKQGLIKLVPSSIVNDIACFVFYDNHPRDEKVIDVTVCTTGGEVIEYYKRSAMCSLNLEKDAPPTDIRIVRNVNCQLFYLVTVADELIILSGKDYIRIHRRIKNVEKYELDDFSCSGQACLKVICKDDAVPMIFDDNFENLGDKALILDGIHADDTAPILRSLKQKLSEAKYTVKCNEKTLDEFLKLRHMSAVSLYEKNRPNTEESMFKSPNDKDTGDTVLDLKTSMPWVKICNDKIIIVIKFLHNSDECLEEMHMLLHGTSRVAMVYTTKLFKKLCDAPFWRETTEKFVKKNKEFAITAVVDLEEVQHVVTNKIEFNGAVSYKRSGKEYLVPFDCVCISGEEVLGKEFGVLTCNSLDETICLALMASTSKTDMVFRHLKKDEEESHEMPELFCSYLQMEKVNNTDNLVTYRNAHYQVLNGVMLFFEKQQNNPDVYNVSVYTRSQSQIVMLMFCVYQTIPHQIVMTTKSQIISTKLEPFMKFNEELSINPSAINYEGYAQSLLKQSEMIIQYMDNCMIKMSESKDPRVKVKIGLEIDFFAQGLPIFKEFKEKLLAEALKGVEQFNNNDAELEKMTVE